MVADVPFTGAGAGADCLGTPQMTCSSQCVVSAAFATSLPFPSKSPVDVTELERWPQTLHGGLRSSAQHWLYLEAGDGVARGGGAEAHRRLTRATRDLELRSVGAGVADAEQGIEDCAAPARYPLRCRAANLDAAHKTFLRGVVVDPGRGGARGSYVAAGSRGHHVLAERAVAQGRTRAVEAVHHRAKLAAVGAGGGDRADKAGRRGSVCALYGPGGDVSTASKMSCCSLMPISQPA